MNDLLDHEVDSRQLHADKLALVNEIADHIDFVYNSFVEGDERGEALIVKLVELINKVEAL